MTSAEITKQLNARDDRLEAKLDLVINSYGDMRVAISKLEIQVGRLSGMGSRFDKMMDKQKKYQWMAMGGLLVLGFLLRTVIEIFSGR